MGLFGFGKKKEKGASTTTISKDPVCGMSVDPVKSAGSATFGGKSYAFCSPSCLQKFNANPGQYAKAS